MSLVENVKRCMREHGEQCAEIERLKAWRKTVVTAADAILVPVTGEFGRVLLESPESELVIQCEGCEVKLTAGHFTALYRATDLD